VVGGGRDRNMEELSKYNDTPSSTISLPLPLSLPVVIALSGPIPGRPPHQNIKTAHANHPRAKSRNCTMEIVSSRVIIIAGPGNNEARSPSRLDPIRRGFLHGQLRERDSVLLPAGILIDFEGLEGRERREIDSCSC
jgi:hypothetical protein